MERRNSNGSATSAASADSGASTPLRIVDDAGEEGTPSPREAAAARFLSLRDDDVEGAGNRSGSGAGGEAGGGAGGGAGARRSDVPSLQLRRLMRQSAQYAKPAPAPSPALSAGNTPLPPRASPVQAWPTAPHGMDGTLPAEVPSHAGDRYGVEVLVHNLSHKDFFVSVEHDRGNPEHDPPFAKPHFRYTVLWFS